MLLGLHVIGLVAIIGFRESELHENFNEMILPLTIWLLFKLKQIVKWMVEEDISLDDFVALDVELILGKSFNSIVIDPLTLHDQD